MPAIDLSSLALILGAMARGPTRVTGADDPGLDGLAAALGALGVHVTKAGAGGWAVHGTGVGGWREPDRVLDLTGRPGAVPLLAGALAAHPFTAVLVGDSDATLATLRGPLERLGAGFALRRLDRLPGSMTGAEWPLPALHRGMGPADGIALLLAGLNSPGRTGVTDMRELAPGLDLLRRFGATIDQIDGTAWVRGHPDLTGADIAVGP
ncbi:hypothetical protein [Niveispirillum sp. KHB5.9]|uniref:hypothetical protein n=1 Tax=Niveispirillum sp. KHB5.9 TaxID=3400269 RepID=UPI003A8A8002